MASVTTVKIAGKTVAGHHFGPHSIPDQLGPSAPSFVWALPPAIAEEVLKLRETEIEITTPTGLSRKWSRIVVVAESPSADPLVRNVILSDIRYYLARVHLRRIFNQRQPAGATKILNAGSSQPVETLQKNAQITYNPASLVGGGSASQGLRPWTADEIVREIGQAIANRTAGLGVPAVTFALKGRSRGNYIPNNLFLSGPGNVVLGQVLAAAGGLDVRVSPDGVLEFVDAFLGSERKTIAKCVNYALENMGTLRLVRMTNVAPSAINVLYVRRLEVRADAWEQAPSATSSPAKGNLPVLENVGLVTDLQVKDVTTGAVYTQNTPVPFDTLLASINALNDAPYWAILPFTRETLINAYLNPKLLEENWVIPPKNDSSAPNLLWAARLAMAFACFRRLYRLNPAFAQRCVPGSIRAERAALIDASTGTFQNSPVYVDHARRWFSRGQASESLHGGNRACFPPDDGQSLARGYTKNYGPNEDFLNAPVPIGQMPGGRSPFEARLVDSVIGMFNIEPAKDPFYQIAETLPSLVTQIPTMDCFAIAKSGGNPYWERSGLSYTHRLALIFTATPAGPNSEASLHRYTVTPGSALNRLGVATGSVNANGPAFDIPVQPTPTLCARFAWDDNKRQILLDCFTSPNGSTVAETLVPVNDLELQDYSTGVAATLMAAMLDHYEGQTTIAFSPDVRPIGSLAQVVHTVDVEGSLWTTLTCRPAIPPVQPEHFISQSTRSNLFQNLGSGAA